MIRHIALVLFVLVVSTCASPQGVLRPNSAVPVTGLKTFGHALKNAVITDQEQTLFEHTGKGVIQEMWFTGGGSHWDQIRIRIYVDGEAKPSIDYLNFMGHGVGFGDQTAAWGTERMGLVANSGGLYNTYKIPFSQSIKITGTGADKDGQTFWFIVRGVENMPVFLGHLQLPDNARLRLHKIEKKTLQPLEFVDLVNITNSGGALYQVTLSVDSTDYNYLEACMRAFVDGSSDPMFLSSGTEDYFLSAFYFNTGTFHMPNSGATHLKGPGEFSGYKFHEEDPILFTKSFTLRWRNMEDSSCPSKWGIVEEEPKPVLPQVAPAVMDSYVWVYEW